MVLLWFFYGFGGRFSGLKGIKRNYEKAKENPRTLYFLGFRGSEPGGIRTHDLLIRSQACLSLGDVDFTSLLAFSFFKVMVFLLSICFIASFSRSADGWS